MTWGEWLEWLAITWYFPKMHSGYWGWIFITCHLLWYIAVYPTWQQMFQYNCNDCCFLGGQTSLTSQPSTTYSVCPSIGRFLMLTSTLNRSRRETLNQGEPFNYLPHWLPPSYPPCPTDHTQLKVAFWRSYAALSEKCLVLTRLPMMWFDLNTYN